MPFVSVKTELGTLLALLTSSEFNAPAELEIFHTIMRFLISDYYSMLTEFKKFPMLLVLVQIKSKLFPGGQS